MNIKEIFGEFIDKLTYYQFFDGECTRSLEIRVSECVFQKLIYDLQYESLGEEVTSFQFMGVNIIKK